MLLPLNGEIQVCT